MAYKLSELLLDYKNNRIELVSEETKTARLNTCESCVNRNMVGVCNKCGCVIAQKVRHVKSSCPIGKW